MKKGRALCPQSLQQEGQQDSHVGCTKSCTLPSASCAHLKWYLLSVATPTVSPLTPSASKREGRETATLKEEEGLEDGRVLP